MFIIKDRTHLFKTLLTSALLIFAPLTHSSECHQLKSMDDLTIGWEAFKTFNKVGVPVEFSNFQLNGRSQAKGLDDLLKGFSISIQTDEKSIQSDDEGRNINIAEFFFKKMTGGSSIQGNITEVDLEKGQLNLSVTMNEVTRDVPLRFSYQSNLGKFEAEGYIDIFDFNLHSQLESITRVCAVHEGKTWNDVKIILKANIYQC